MIIKRIYINRFGGLSDFSLDLNSGFNLVFGNNEDGKTTVMSFVRMMFYSTGTSKSDVKLNLRKRFTPFSGEKAAGEIEFNHNGKDYILSKQFGKSAHSDKVTLLDVASGKPLTVSGDVGEEFFGMTWEAFERSIFVGSLQSDGKGSAELSSKLKATVYTGDTGDSYEDILKRLTDAQSVLRTKKRVGVSDRLEDRLYALESELEEAKGIEERRRENQTLQQETDNKLNEIYKTRDELKKAEALSRNAELVGSLKTELSEREQFKFLNSQNGDFNIEKAALCDTLLNERSQLLAKIEAQRAVLADTDDTENNTIDDELLAALDELQRAMAVLESAKAEADKLIPAEKKSPVGLFALGAAFAVCAVFAVFIKWLLLCAIPAVILLVSGVISVGNNGKKKRKTELMLLEKRQQIAALEDTKRTLNDRYIILKERKSLFDSTAATKARETEKRTEALKFLEKEAEEKEKTLCTLLRTDSVQSINDALKNKRDILNRLLECERWLKKSPHSTLSTDEIKEKIAQAPTDELQSPEWYQERLSLLERDIAKEISSLERLKAENRNLLLSHRGIAEIETEIVETRARLSAQNEHYNSLALAQKILGEANDEMRQNFAPELNRLTSKLFDQITRGKHGRVTVSSELELTVSEDGAVPFAGEYLSAGGLDQAELCLRLAIAELTGADNALPLLLDDVLMQYDDLRARDAVEFLSAYAKDKQVLLFTCHGYFKGLSREAGATVIDMKK